MSMSKRGTAAAAAGSPRSPQEEGWTAAAMALRRLARRVKPPPEQFRITCYFAAATTLFFVLVIYSFALLRSGKRAAVLGRAGTWWGGLVDVGGGGGGRECDWFEGTWVLDENYPLYESKDCPFLDDGFRCSENGRPDRLYAKWRWQPAACNLPRFNARKLLKKLRNKRLVFIGDSIGRNQWESLLCLLSSAVSNKSSIFEVNGSPITKHNGFLIFKFRDYNCTVEYYRSPFLVVQGRAPAGSMDKVRMTLRLDVMDWTSSRWRSADILIFNTGHWWNYEKTIRSGCYFQEGNKVKMEMTVDDAYHRSITTVLDWIGKEVNQTKTQVFFRTYAPVHFRGGDWKTGGSCHLEQFPDLGPSQLSLKPWASFLEPFRNLTRGTVLELLNITHMTARRKDGHLSLYYLGPTGPAPLHKEDCSHWCLPGVPDAWNELLYALLLRKDLKTRGKLTGAVKDK